MRSLVAAFLLFVAAMGASPAYAQNSTDPPPVEAQTTTTTTTTNPPAVPENRARSVQTDEASVVAESGKALVKLFVLAVLLESALALIFNWRPFLAVFDGRGVKSIVSLVGAAIIIWALRPLAIESLMKGYGTILTPSGRDVASILEAMIIAGGSAGVNNMLRALGFRSQTRAEEVAPKPPTSEAWISVGLTRDLAVGPVDVELTAGSGAAQIAGTIRGRLRKRGLLSYFVRDYARFPPSGGYVLTPGTDYTIQLKGRDGQGQPLESAAWGPHQLANRAIVDIELKI